MNALNPMAVLAAVLGDGALDVADVFSTDLYTGNSSTQSITNGLDLSGEGGLTWIKARGGGAQSHYLFDTDRGPLFVVSSDSTAAQFSFANTLTSFNSDGFSLGSETATNFSGRSFASWSFRIAPGFHGVVTWTGTATAGRQIPHNLGVAPGMVLVKRYAGAGGAIDWAVWHRSLAEDDYLKLNTTDGAITNASFPPFGKPAEMTSTYITLGQSDATGPNGITDSSGDSFVAYLFAHDASDSGIIQCGSFTANGSGGYDGSSDLGWQPQFFIHKKTNNTDAWRMYDSARGVSSGGADAYLDPSSTDAEASFNLISFDPAGFTIPNVQTPGDSFMYLAIRAEGA